MSVFYNSTNNSVKNFGGAILKGGDVNSSNFLSLKAVNSSNEDSNHPYASVPVLNADTTKALGGNEFVFAFNNPRALIKKITSVINNGSMDHELSTSGTLDTSLITGIHKRTTNTNRLDTTAIRNSKFSLYSGKFDVNYPEVSQDSFGNDVAASPTRLNPGVLNFTLGKTVSGQQYNSKTG